MNAFFSIPIRKEDQKQFAVMWNEHKKNHLQFYPKAMLTLLHFVVAQRDLECLDISQNVTSIHFINYIMLFGQDKHEVLVHWRNCLDTSIPDDGR